MSNDSLRRAKSAKCDEFYTRYEDVEAELTNYSRFLHGKTVYCNCDDPERSNFWKYLYANFGVLGLKKLISTHYEADGPSYRAEYDGGTVVAATPLKGSGDFRSEECVDILKTSDVVITNPPFSLFREYVAQLMEYGKKFLILGNMNAICYKEVFPLIKNNRIWLGYNSGNMRFQVPEDYTSSSTVTENGIKYAKFGNTCWFTNMDVKYRHDGLWHKDGVFDNSQALCYYEGNEDEYPKYDNYDAINVDKTKDIPIDYEGIMGVPITWLDKYSPDEFEIIGLDRYTIPKDKLIGGRAGINGKPKYARIFIRYTDEWIASHPDDFRKA